MAFFSPNVEQWRPLLLQHGSGLPIDFLLKFIEHESGGNPCSTGICINSSGQQVGCLTSTAVFAKEAGIFQTFHPDNDRFGATSPQLRAACRGLTQQLSRALSDPEKTLHVTSGINLIKQLRETTRILLSQSGTPWSEETSDFWKLVKLNHGLPALAGTLPIVVRVLGRPPVNWTEFHNTANALTVDQLPAALRPFKQAPSVAGRSSRIADVLANADTVGAFVGNAIPPRADVKASQQVFDTGSRAGSFVKGFFAIGFIAALGFFTWRYVAKRTGHVQLAKVGRLRSKVLHQIARQQ